MAFCGYWFDLVSNLIYMLSAYWLKKKSTFIGASKMTQQLKACATKPGGLGLISRGCVIEGESWLLWAVLWLPHMSHDSLTLSFWEQQPFSCALGNQDFGLFRLWTPEFIPESCLPRFSGQEPFKLISISSLGTARIGSESWVHIHLGGSFSQNKKINRFFQDTFILHFMWQHHPHFGKSY